MNSKTEDSLANTPLSSDIEASSGSVYADLELPDAQSMGVKAQLASKISDILHAKKMNQTMAAQLLGLPQPKVSALLRGQFRGISEAKMLQCLNNLGRDVHIVVKRPRRSHATGRTQVMMA